MNNKTFWFGWVAVYVVMQVIGFVIHGVLMTDSYEALAAVFRPKEEMDSMMGIMLVSSAVGLAIGGAVFAAIYKPSGDL